MERVEALAVGLLAIPADAQQATQSDPAEPLQGNAHTKRHRLGDGDIAQFAGYLSSLAPPTINCNVSRGSTLMTCAGGVNDFAVGEGVSIPGPALRRPSRFLARRRP